MHEGDRPRARPHIVILGAGFAGLECAKALKRAPVDVTVVDRQNHHLFQPLLYQVATAALAAPDIAAPIRKILRRQRNATVLLDDVVGFELDQRRVLLARRGPLAYDVLVVAAGSRHTYFGHEEWETFAPGLKTLSDAFEIRRRILLAFEAAEREAHNGTTEAWQTFAVIGGGPTGVELAGAIAEIAKRTMARDFRRFDPTKTRVVLVEALDRILNAYSPELSEKAADQLRSLGVEIRTRAPVTRVDATGVWLGDEHLAARTVLWGAGVAGSPLGRLLSKELHRSGRVKVRETLQLMERDDVFVAGDLAYLETQAGAVPALAPAAIQEGRHVARNILHLVERRPLQSFRYVDKGSLATIGRSRAVGQVGPLELSGVVAWWAWLFVHLLYLVGFRNRVMVLVEWAWAYLTFQRSARIVIEPGRPEPPLVVDGQKDTDHVSALRIQEGSLR